MKLFIDRNEEIKPVKNADLHKLRGKRFLFLNDVDVFYKNAQHRFQDTFIELGSVVVFKGVEIGYAAFEYEGVKYYMEDYNFRSLIKKGWTKEYRVVKRPEWLSVIHCETEGVRVIRANIVLAKRREARLQEMIKQQNEESKAG